MALTKHVLLVWVACFLFMRTINNAIEGSSISSQQEDIEFEKQLTLLNKPSIKTIKTENGDIYDCVDFYKQPAFDHPLLRNHTFHFQMKPSSLPNKMRRKEPPIDKTNVLHIGIKGLGCPFGTVPIRRVTKDDLNRAKLHSPRYGSTNGSKFSVLTFENPGTHYAIVRTKFDLKKKYNGGGTQISIYDPSVGSSQYSSARMKIQNGPDNIQVGWTVNPTLYGSNDVRLYTYLKTSQSRCFNTQCPGFVIVNSDIPLDAILPASQRGSLPTYVLDVLIFRDEPTGNWWLAIAEDNRQIGFWPKEIFTGLADLAFDVEWGGEVNSPPDTPSPPMGSSNFLEEESRYDAFCMDIATVNEAREIVDAVDTEEYRDIDAYQIKDEGYVKEPFRHLMFFGGPGGTIGDIQI